MKQYINNNYKLLVTSQMFLKFDLFVFQYEDELIDDAAFFNDIFNNNININAYFETTNSYRLSNNVNYVKVDTNRENINLCYKSFYAVNINTNGAFDFYIENIYKHIRFIFIKKFDGLNYISPLCASVGLNFLRDYNYEFSLEELLEDKDNLYKMNKLIIKYSNITW